MLDSRIGLYGDDIMRDTNCLNFLKKTNKKWI